MKKLLFIIFLFLSFGSFGQTDRELLLKLADKIDKIAEQQTITSTKVDALQKQMDVRFEATDKRIDILLYVMIAILTGIFGLIGFVLWDRQASVKPILQENKELAKEIQKLEQRELKLEEKLENYMKKVAQIDPRFTGIL
jgi:Tfp pilus assembly protein PilN